MEYLFYFGSIFSIVIMAREGSPIPGTSGAIPTGTDLRALIKGSLVEVLQENPQLLQHAVTASGQQSQSDERGKSQLGFQALLGDLARAVVAPELPAWEASDERGRHIYNGGKTQKIVGSTLDQGRVQQIRSDPYWISVGYSRYSRIHAGSVCMLDQGRVQ